MSVTLYEYAALCSVIYTDHRTKTPKGWRCIHDSGEKSSGFRGQAWTNAPEGITDTSGYDVVIVVRGTENLAGGWNDFQLVVAITPSQYQDLKEFYNEVFWYHRNANISVTGHSLGGGLVQLLNVEFSDQQHHTVTFEAPGMSQVAQHYGWNLYNNSNYDTENYWRYSDGIAWGGAFHIGRNVRLSPTVFYDFWHTPIGKMIGDEHSIDGLADDIRTGRVSPFE